EQRGRPQIPKSHAFQPQQTDVKRISEQSEQNRLQRSESLGKTFQNMVQPQAPISMAPQSASQQIFQESSLLWAPVSTTAQPANQHWSQQPPLPWAPISTTAHPINQDRTHQHSLLLDPISTSVHSINEDKTQEPLLPWTPVSTTMQPACQDRIQQPPLPWTTVSTKVYATDQDRTQQTSVSFQKDALHHSSQHLNLGESRSLSMSNVQYIDTNNGNFIQTENVRDNLHSFSLDVMTMSSIPQSISQQTQYYYRNNVTKDQQLTTFQPPQLDPFDIQRQKQIPDSQEWSPVMDLSPIVDVSPSVEAAEQKLMEKYQELIPQMSMPRVTSGNIPEMLASFQRSSEANPKEPQFKMQQISFSDSSSLYTMSSDSSRISNGIPVTSEGQPVTHNVIEMTRSMLKEHRTSALCSQAVTTSQPQSSKAAGARRIHRRLPQPTLEQMQEAIALASQTPKFKSTQYRNQGVSSNKGPTRRNISPETQRKGMTEKSQVLQHQNIPQTPSELEKRSQMIKISASDTQNEAHRPQTSNINSITSSAFQSFPVSITPVMVSTTGTSFHSSVALSYQRGIQTVPSFNSQFDTLYNNGHTLKIHSPLLYSKINISEPEKGILTSGSKENIHIGYSRSFSVPDSVSKIGTYTQLQSVKVRTITVKIVFNYTHWIQQVIFRS
ncbi:uncharacterized protein LOC111084013, partial [Limulus polyphemus]|uniref:Uncharacterized protein LOC111084013 n=1 Tax=Limulus polyphemus TaxID=6850 RepID=A0ABM1RYP1_LIMPO